MDTGEVVDSQRAYAPLFYNLLAQGWLRELSEKDRMLLQMSIWLTTWTSAVSLILR